MSTRENIRLIARTPSNFHPYASPYGPRREKTCLQWFSNNKGADQPAPLLFTYWKVSYVDLPGAKFYFSS